MSTLALLEGLRKIGRIRAIDCELARELARHAGDGADAVALAAALASAALGRGHVCVDLRELQGAPLGGLGDAGQPPLDVESFTAALRAEPGVCGHGADAAPRPLVLAGGRLYLGRYWRAEQRVATRLRALASQRRVPGADTVALLQRLFAEDSAGAAGQRRACATALTRGLGVVTGGPGTGKTTTVARLLVFLAADARSAGRTLAVRLVAPTGKAAARAAESLARERARLLEGGQIDAALAAALPERAETLHRLLGARADGDFRHGPADPLPADVVVVDECSMVDLGLFDALLGALQPHARLVLLGDRDQLDAVEAGNVFGAVCAQAGSVSPARAAELQHLAGSAPAVSATASAIADATAVLEHSYRFDAAGGIGRLAQAVNAGDADAARAVLNEGDARVQALACGARPGAQQVEALAAGYVPLLEALASGADDTALLGMLEHHRVLCAVREGDFGVAGINRAIEATLAAQGRIDPARGPLYPGQPLLVTRNDHCLRLYNGDLGLVVPGPDGREQVLFRAADGTPRRLPPGRLPEHETAWAMTIHKSQGSESERVCIVLPPDVTRAEFGGREMLYTAITRARQRVMVLVPGGEIDGRWFRRVGRMSGLVEGLHG
jgi:exodeoxyribonuclease V alpha subunit